jgi:thiol-disulfide isomerase/thioredoxin
MLSDYKGKVLVLDVWHRQCGVCFQKFPDFNSLSNRYKGNEDVQFFAVNHPIGSDNYTKSLKKMEALAYDFEHLYLPSDTIAGKLGVQFYPTLLVINKDQTRYVMTQIELSPWVYNNTSVIIDQMLAE